MAEPSKFTWVQTHKEIVQYLKNMKDRQLELISELEKAGVDGFTDKDALGNTIKLDEMDPFTFFFYIYKYGEQKRLQILRNIASNLGFSVPSDTYGVPSANALSVRVFPQKEIRTHDEVNRLWAFFHKAISHQVTDDDVEDVLNIVSLGKAKLSEALFMVDPEYYLCIDGQTNPYLKKVLGIDPRFNTYNEYMAILARVREKTQMPFPELSHEAWKWNTTHNKTNYWVFQCNPKVYDIVSALRGKTEARWRVAQHRNDIKIGDKLILWVTGEKAGCYALGEIISEVEYGVRDLEDQAFYKDNSYNVPGDRVMISLLYNLVDKPILKSKIEGINELKGLNVGLQGTNFTATQKQYAALERLAQASSPNESTKRYWIYTPGSNGDKWDEFYNQGIMAIGWDELGDLSQFTSKEEVETELRKLSGQNEIKKTNDALANWQFKHRINIGDIIISKKGQTVLLGYGVVKSNFKYDPDRSEYKKFREVQWVKKGEWEMEPPHVVITKTLTDITNYETSHPNYKYYQDLALAVMNGEFIDYPPMPNSEHRTDHPLNLILFGPPGTGKTYKSISLAVEIADPELMRYDWGKPVTREDITRRYKELVDEGRIVFTTFHQSMSYEDFIEGIKPVTRTGGVIGYEVVDGIFKVLGARASREDRIRITSQADDIVQQGTISDDEFSSLFDLFLQQLPQDNATGRSNVVLHTPSNNSPFDVFRASGKPTIVVRAGDQRYANSIAKKELVSVFKKEKEPYYPSYEPVLINMILNMQGSGIVRTVRSPLQRKPFILIIDEINRGNVSQIFGELITLIEPDKRAGKPESLEAVLPYSKEKFSVPANLHIIGTMNTADRSVEALDTALRRRFSFKEMTPEYELLEGITTDGIELADLLRTINNRIEGLLDKDHVVGHSYFLRVANGETTLVDVFFNEIIPLLQEYFYGNFGRMELVLGRRLVQSTPVTQSIFARPSSDNDEFNDHVRYTLARREEMDEAAFQRALRVLMNESDEA